MDDVRVRARSWEPMSDGSGEAVRDAVRAQLADPRAGGGRQANEHQKRPLVDLGFGTAHAGFCVRTDRPPLIDALMVVPTARSTSSFRVRR